MPTPIVVLFYLWLAVSVVVLVTRLATRRGRKTPVVRSADREPILPADWAPPEQPTAPAADPVIAAAPAPPATAPTTPTAATTPPPPMPPTVNAPAGAASASLMEALAGITLPCDLMPLTTAEGRQIGNRDLLLITSGHTGIEVGRALGEAVEALGYTLTPMANNDLVAVRGNDRISIAVHDRPEGLLSGKRQEFPTAKAGDVVVELRL